MTKRDDRRRPTADRRWDARRMACTFAVLCVLIAASPTWAQQVRLFADVDTVTVGERFRLTIVAEGNGAEVLLPGVGSRIGALEVIGVERYVPGERVDTLVATAAAFGLDSVAIAVPVQFVPAEGDTVTVVSPPMRLVVRSLVTPADSTIRDLRGLAPLPRAPFWWWPYAAAALAALLFFVWWRRRRAQAPPPPAPAAHVGPYQEALVRLDALEHVHPVAPDAAKPYYDELTETVRAYLAATLGVPALELTSRELLTATFNLLPRPAHDTLSHLLPHADLVKFADHEPPPDRSRTALASARSVVETTEAALRAASAEAGRSDE